MKVRSLQYVTFCGAKVMNKPTNFCNKMLNALVLRQHNSKLEIIFTENILRQTPAEVTAIRLRNFTNKEDNTEVNF